MLWNGLQVVTAIATIAQFLILFTNWLDKTSHLEVILDSDTVLIDSGPVSKLPVRIVWNDPLHKQQHEIDIQSVRVGRFKFLNSGSAPFIWARDVISPIAIHVPDGRILTVSVDTSDGTPGVAVRHTLSDDGREVGVSADVLNPGEYFALYVAYDAKSNNAHLLGRVLGPNPLYLNQKPIQTQNSIRNPAVASSFYLLVGFPFMFLALILSREVLRAPWLKAIKFAYGAGILVPLVVAFPVYVGLNLWPADDPFLCWILWVVGFGVSIAGNVVAFRYWRPYGKFLLLAWLSGAPAAREALATTAPV